MMAANPAPHRPLTRPIRSQADLDHGLRKLSEADPALQPLIAACGEVPFSASTPDLKGLARIIVGQQLSVASAGAIWRRVESLLPVFDVPSLATKSDGQLAGCGLSAAKIAAIRAVAARIASGLDLQEIAGTSEAQARALLTDIKGIGPWSAEIFLLFCAGHPDIFPAGDLALRRSFALGLDLDDVPDARSLAQAAQRWAPWRSVAARLFWAYYRHRRHARNVLPV